ncbi:MAG: hypothetical protein CMO77_04780 [Verrucomicrobiales bacterium]|nr:hypothetical protein [Verrucomicrobiales bacterium]
MPPAECPNCGSVVPLKASACPDCGACENTGWSEDAENESYRIEGAEFDYDDFIAREFEEGGKPESKRLNLVFLVVAIVLVFFFVTQIW